MKSTILYQEGETSLGVYRHEVDNFDLIYEDAKHFLCHSSRKQECQLLSKSGSVLSDETCISVIQSILGRSMVVDGHILGKTTEKGVTDALWRPVKAYLEALKYVGVEMDDPCNRNGCQGIISEMDDLPIGSMGVECNECEWNESGP